MPKGGSRNIYDSLEDEAPGKSKVTKRGASPNTKNTAKESNKPTKDSTKPTKPIKLNKPIKEEKRKKKEKVEEEEEEQEIEEPENTDNTEEEESTPTPTTSTSKKSPPNKNLINLRDSLKSYSNQNLKNLGGSGSPLRHSSSIPKEENGEEEELATGEDATFEKYKDQDLKIDDSGEFWRELIIRIIVLIAAVWVVQRAPEIGGDVKKVPGYSFLQYYIAGKLNSIDFVNHILIAATSSLFFDVAVVYYHLTNPPHPKFVLAYARKLSIYTHLISGILEIVTGVIGFTVSDHEIQQYAVTVMAIVSITHALTAYYQVTVVFGAKGIMVPGYLYAITIHITYATRLFLNPTSAVYLFSTFLTLHIYVWCRFFVFFFRFFNAFAGYQYTIAITLSGALLFPYTMGPVGNFGFLFIGTLYCVLQWLSHRTGNLSNILFLEHERYALVTKKAVEIWKNDMASSTGATNNDERMAREVFDQFDVDQTGKLGMNEIQQMIKVLELNNTSAKKIMNDVDVNGDGVVAFDEFYRYIWNYGTIGDRLVKRSGQKKSSTLSEEEEATLVFEMLDVDSSGKIGKSELTVLLGQWGSPVYEVDAYLSKYFTEGQKIDFDTFYTQLKPIWKFAASEVFQA